MNRALALLGLLAALGCGCATTNDAPKVARPAPDKPGTVTISFESTLGFPYRITSIDAVMDGEVLYTSRGTSTLELGSTTLGAVSLDERPHWVGLHVRVEYASGSPGNACVLELRSALSFGGAEAGGTIVARMVDAGSLADFSERPRLSFASSLPQADPSKLSIRDENDRQCAEPSKLEGAICRTEARLQKSLAEHDDEMVRTLGAKLTEMKALDEATWASTGGPRDAANKRGAALFASLGGQREAAAFPSTTTRTIQGRYCTSTDNPLDRVVFERDEPPPGF